MGIYLNPGNENYRRALLADVYVDKTMMLDVLNKFIDIGNNFVCISRPRRFGKTMAQNMIAAYYSKGCDSRELFLKLNISGAESYEEKRNKFNVIQIDLNGEYQMAMDKGDMLADLTGAIREEMQETWPDINFTEKDSLARCILKVYRKTGETFVILIDEYDVLVREQVPKDLFDEYLGFLNSLFKNNTLRPALSLAYITGILPVVRDKVQSKLNEFREYTILDAKELAEFVGFTAPEVTALCAQYGMDYEECRRWYDGYSQHGIEIYNPESVVQSMSLGYYDDYWGKTSTYLVVADMIRQNFGNTRDDVIRMLSGENIRVNVRTYMNTMTDFKTEDDVFTYLLHTGYLAYNMEDRTCRIPNGEIREEWINAVAIEKGYEETDRIIKDSENLLAETLAGNEAAVAKALDASHINATSNRSYNNEDALSCAIYLAYIYALNEYTVVKEMTAGKGFADVVYVPFKENKTAMIIELKHNKAAGTALNQIKEKQYFECLRHYQGNLLFVGVNYDETNKTHTCRIERFRKTE